MAAFSIGYHLTFICYFASFVLQNTGVVSELKVEKYAIVYGLVNTTLCAAGLFVNKHYIDRYINKKDDLVGETDMLRRVIKDKMDPVSIYTYIRLIRELKLPVSMSLLNFSLNTVAQNLLVWHLRVSMSNRDLPFNLILLLSNVAECLGAVICLSAQIYNSLSLVATTVPRVLLFGTLMYSTANSKEWFESTTVLLISLCVFMLLNGFNKVQLFAMAARRVEDKQKKNVGFLMMLILCAGTSYGDLTSLGVIKDSLSDK